MSQQTDSFGFFGAYGLCRWCCLVGSRRGLRGDSITGVTSVTGFLSIEKLNELHFSVTDGGAVVVAAMVAGWRLGTPDSEVA